MFPSPSQKFVITWQNMKKLTSSLLIISTCSLLLNSSHSSLYRSISSLVCLIFFFKTSRREPCWIFVVILVGFCSLNCSRTNFFQRKSDRTPSLIQNDWASHRQARWRSGRLRNVATCERSDSHVAMLCRLYWGG